ncbi:PRC and DUF2382 domain-containing protein [Couchioplanes caeruleus]|uniref:DUF2382 domain-containing protein n=1 Tax=Couchioplanes caeruleus TaxID=56438 RepID=UPI0020BF5960|nr:PRC and DUF2382 domain-containing protein [Couchioplanes caeruleus]UQU61476.1 PRC and DUF2382 domain-containing protein [Couchioplanes caeruleus]
MITRNDIPRLYGMDVYETDGSKIGSTAEIYLDEQTGEPEWLAVKTGLFGTKQSFVPLQRAEVGDDRITVPFAKDQVKDAPRIDPDGRLTPQEEDELYRHYGLSSTGGTLDSSSGRESRTEGRDSWTDRGENRTETSETATGTGRYDTDRRDTDRYDTERTGTDRATSRSADTSTDAMTRSEERLVADTEREQVGKARLRKYVVTEQEQVTVPVTREEVRLEREPVTEANRGDAFSGPDITESEHEVTLHAERPVVETEAVPVERVRLGKETVRDEETVRGEVRKEQIDFDDPNSERR